MNFYPFLKSLGISTFINYFYQIKEKNREELKVFFDREVFEQWSPSSIATKTSNAKSIFNNHLEVDALNYILFGSSKVSRQLILKAREIYESELSTLRRSLEEIKHIKNHDHEGIRESKYRKTQQIFKAELLKKYGSSCVVTGINNMMLLRASHIKPWAISNDDQKISVDNGLLLSPVYDYLFDKNLISFRQSGEIMISKTLTRAEISLMGINSEATLRIEISGELAENLKWHREKLL